MRLKPEGPQEQAASDALAERLRAYVAKHGDPIAWTDSDERVPDPIDCRLTAADDQATALRADSERLVREAERLAAREWER